MDFLPHLAMGFSEILSIENLGYSLLGVTVGTLIGVLPGIGPLTAMATLLPLTFVMPPMGAVVLLSGIYYGAQYGGSITAILINMPGESSSAVTTLDGYQMARRGEAGPALAAAAMGSFFAGTIATIVIAAFAVPLARMASSFGSAEYFALMLLGLVSSIVLSNASILKALGTIVLGLLLGLVGTDMYTGSMRMTLGYIELADGISLLALSVGIFGVAEILSSLHSNGQSNASVAKINRTMPNLSQLKRIFAPAVRGTVIGSILGILPGGGALISSFAAYAVEKKVSSHRDEFGKGAIEGVVAPESANNAGAQTSFIPMLSMGIPSNPIMALMIGALMIQGITAGPGFISEQPVLFWGLIASMWVGNVFLLILNLPLVRIWVSLLKIPYRLLFPAIIIFATIGIYSESTSTFHLVELIIFGVGGYFLRRIGCEPTPLILGFILGPMMEEHLRRAMIFGRGDPLFLVASPIALVLIVLSVAILILAALPSIRSKREKIVEE